MTETRLDPDVFHLGFRAILPFKSGIILNPCVDISLRFQSIWMWILREWAGCWLTRLSHFSDKSNRRISCDQESRIFLFIPIKNAFLWFVVIHEHSWTGLAPHKQDIPLGIRVTWHTKRSAFELQTSIRCYRSVRLFPIYHLVQTLLNEKLFVSEF